MIIEGIVSTIDTDGQPHWAAMGPYLDEERARIELRPFQPSTTLENLQRHPLGVFHIVDDARLIAQSAIGKFDRSAKHFPAEKIEARVLDECCRWIEFKIDHIDTQPQRATLNGSILFTGRRNDFRGLNRARNAIVEAAILATRIEFLPFEFVETEYKKLREIVVKTGSPAEHETFEMLDQFIRNDLLIRDK